MRLLKTRKQEAEGESKELIKIRPDLNLEKWAIWQPSSSQNKPKTQFIERAMMLSDGSTKTAKVEVGFTHRGALTTQDQRVFYALIKIWEENGQSITYTHISLKRLAKTLGMKWGTRIIKTLTDSIDRLLLTPFLWEHSYYNAETKETVEVMENPFTILSERKIIKAKKDGHITREEGYFRFHPLIVKNLLANYTKPVLFETVLSFKSEIAQILYTQLDLFLASKTHYERRTRELFADLGLEGESYKHAANRKQKLEPALKELLGKPLSNGGVIIRASLEPAKTTNDYKVVFEKRSRAVELVTPETTPPAPTPSPALVAPVVPDAHTVRLVSALKSFGVSEAKARELVKAVKSLQRVKMFHS